MTFEDGDENLYLSDPTGLNVCPLDTLYLGRNCKSQSSTGYVKEFPNKNIKVLIVGNHIVRLEGEGLGEKMSSFKDCSELKSVTIGNSVTYIGSSTFSGCEDIETIVSLSTNPPDLISSAFEKTVYTFGTLFVPANAGSAYRSHSVWGKFAEIVELNSLPVYVANVSLDKTSLTFSAFNATQTLTATITPSNASNKTLTWTSSNTNIATVDNNGVVTAKGYGTATITATTTDGSNKSATCSVTVAAPILVTGVSLSQTSLTFSALNTTQTLTATVTPSNADNKTLTWTSSNTNVATVSSSGVVTSKGNGTATITAKATDGSNISATCTVTVIESVHTSISEGYYTIVSAGKGPGYYTGTNPGDRYNDEGKYALYNDSGLVKWKEFDANDYSQIYHITSSGDGDWYIYNLADGSYIDRQNTDAVPLGQSVYAGKVITSTEKNTPQVIEGTNQPGKWTIRFKGNEYVYGLTASHDGSNDKTSGEISIWGSQSETNKFGMNVWYLSNLTLPKATNIVLNLSELALAKGQTRQLAATVSPANALPVVAWGSSDPDVATVSEDGLITAKGYGTATITATTTDGSNKSATCSVTVDTNINLTDIAHWEVSYNASYGYTFKDIATGLYMNTKGNSSTHQAITYNVGKSDKGSCWKLLDSKGNNVVSFNTQEKYYLYNLGGWQGGYAYENKDDQRIFILAPDLSSAEPIQFVSDGNGYYYICMNGKYVAQPTQNIEDLKLKEKTLATATSISIDYSELSLEIGQTQYLKATVTPTEALQSVTWKSSNESVATVSENGLVTAKSNGTARITATTADGSNLSATCTVTVMIPVDGISLSNTSLTFSAIDSKETLTATVTPSNASNKNLEWTSSNPDVATVTSIVSNRGVVTAKGNGTATITARTKDGSNISATCTVTVTIPVDGISLSNTSLTFTALNTTQTLTATVTPSSAANKKLTWTSSNTNVATVNSNGVVTSKGNGTATITAKATDGSNISATCSVTVSAPILVTGVSLNKTSLTFSALNTTQTLTATVTPSDASNKILNWTSSNTDVATVNIYGVVTSKGYGTATITATATDGSNKSATCSVTVSKPKYTLKFVADGKVVSESSVEYGSTITVPAAPAKTGYTFVSWGDVATTMPAKDLTYTAQYKVNQYKLTYMIDGRVYKTYTLDYNSVINPEGDAEDDDYYYGWEDIPDRMPDHDVQVNAYITKVLGWAKSIDDKTAIYTLDGQKVVNPIKGNIYIINGKKVRY